MKKAILSILFASTIFSNGAEIIAHRGDWTYAPENTVEAAQLTISRNQQVNSAESQGSVASLVQAAIAGNMPSLHEVIRARDVSLTPVLSHPDVVQLLKANDKCVTQ